MKLDTCGLRSRAHRRLVVLAGALAAASLAQAGESPGTTGTSRSTRRVSWPEVVRLVERHPGTAAARLRVEAARAGVAAARAVPNPQLEAHAGQGAPRDVASGGKLEWDLALNVPLDWIAQRHARGAAARAEVGVAEAEAKRLRQELLLELRILFWNLIYEQERVAALDALDQQTAALRRSVKLRVEKGEARPVEQLRVDVEAARLAGELEAARLALAARGEQLGLWLGAQRGEVLAAVADLGALPALPPVEAVRQRVRTAHPTLLVAQARTRSLAAELDVERHGRVPAFALNAFTEQELDRRAYGVGFSLDLPLWNWNSGRIRRAERLLAAGKEQLEVERLEIETAALEAQATCRGGIALAAHYQAEVLPQAQAAAATVDRTYQLGEATLLEVIDARRTLLETRRSYLAALVQAQTDCSRLRAALGEDLP